MGVRCGSLLSKATTKLARLCVGKPGGATIYVGFGGADGWPTEGGVGRRCRGVGYAAGLVCQSWL